MKASNCKRLALTWAAAAALVLNFSGAALAQQTSIGVFDLQKVLGDSKKGKAAKNDLEGNFKKLQGDLKKKEEEINKLSGELRKLASSGTAKQDDLRKKDENLKKQVSTYQEQLAKSNEEMRKLEEQKLKPLADKAVQAAGELAKERGYTVVLETQQAGVVFAIDSVDMTDEIIKAVDK